MEMQKPIQPNSHTSKTNQSVHPSSSSVIQLKPNNNHSNVSSTVMMSNQENWKNERQLRFFHFAIVSQSLCTFISAGSKLAQLQCLWHSKDSGQVSGCALTWALATYTCLARIFTTVITTGDAQVLIRFVVMNMWVTVTVIYYTPHAVKQD
ncbi:solute carrier family 66 member 3-like [Carassius gibelio]|uniref:solute carrier family 66 member 3-like n=1 Tax=Carassius gibelio TaxID=101364 RepID=UPI00227953A3|nr:solute carrier family 66 member 3-like [Carassius gibelio]